MHRDPRRYAPRFRTALLTLGLAAALGGVAAPALWAQGQNRPNILLVTIDDIGVEALAHYGVGSDFPSTPILEGLAAQGVSFRNAYSYVLCSPSRACIQTGRYGMRHGIGWLVDDSNSLSTSEFLLPELLDTAPPGHRYAHAAIGKWHLGRDAAAGGLLAPNVAGYSHYAGTLRNILAPESYFSYTRVVNGVATPSTTYVTSQNVDDALAWIGQQSQPWFCSLSFQAAHEPLHAPPNGLFTTDLSAAGSPLSNPRPFYKAMVESVDTELGRLLSSLGPQLAETIVIVVGDNGTPQRALIPPYQSNRGKSTLYEAGIHVPMIVSGPPVQFPGTWCEALVDLTDIFATVAEISGISLPGALPPGRKLDSVSLMPYLADPTTPSIKNVVLAERFFPNTRAAAQPISGAGMSSPVCQPDIGFGGPGLATLSFCASGLLARGNLATLGINNAPPQAPGLLFVASGLSPLSAFGGTFASGFGGVQVPFVCDSSGSLSIGGWGTGATFDQYPFGINLYLQAILLDLNLPEMLAFTNTVRAEFLNENRKALRNDRYKLIDSVHGGEFVGGPDELYDLQNDPLELQDLLLGTLTNEQQAAYTYLKTRLHALMADALTGN